MIARFVLVGMVWALAATSVACDRAKPMSREEWEALPEVYAGKILFITRCGRCHGVTGGPPRTGPDLLGITARRSDDHIRRWVADPKSIDPKAQMLPVPLDEVQMHRLLAFLHALPDSMAAELPRDWRWEEGR